MEDKPRGAKAERTYRAATYQPYQRKDMPSGVVYNNFLIMQMWNTSSDRISLLSGTQGLVSDRNQVLKVDSYSF